MRTFEPMWCPHCEDVVPVNVSVIVQESDLPPVELSYGVLLAGLRVPPDTTLRLVLKRAYGAEVVG